MEICGEVEGREPEGGHTHFKSTRTMKKNTISRQQATGNRCGAGSVSIKEGPGERAGNCRWLGEYGLRVES